MSSLVRLPGQRNNQQLGKKKLKFSQSNEVPVMLSVDKG